MQRWVVFLLCGLSLSMAQPVKLALDKGDHLAKKTVEKTIEARYSEAWLAADSLAALLPNHPAGPLLHALASFARYDDLSEVVDLRRAARKLRLADSLSQKLNDPFWSGITEYERGYEMTIWRSEIKGALAIRSGAKKLSKLSGNVDARAMAAIYDYYFSDAMAWIPFVSDEREDAVARLERGIAQSRYFGALFRTALVWVYWAKGEIDAGLAVVDPIVKNYPTNRIFLQARGDLLRKGGRYKEAFDAYHQSLEIYGRVAPKSVRYLCAVGNLAIIQHQLGNMSEAAKYGDRFREGLPPLRDRMPDSLMDELKKFGYL